MEKKETNTLLLQIHSQLNLETQAKIDNQTLLRFLNSNHNNVEVTIKIIKEFLIWKQKLDLEVRLGEEQIKQLKKIYPHGYSGVDKEGRPVLVQQIGKVKANELFKLFEDNKLINYLFQRMEQLTGQFFKKVEKKELIVILDLNGPIMKMASKRVYNLVNNAVSIFQKFYPGVLHKLYFVNTPMLFETSWNFIKDGINKDTHEKINFIGSDFQDELLKIIDKSNLPEFLGGDLKEECYLSNRPWNDQINDCNSNKNSDSEEQQQDSIDLSSLKVALTNILPKNQPHILKGVADTPVNTESDQKN